MNKSVSQLSKNTLSTNSVDSDSLTKWLHGLTFDQAYQQYEEQGYILFKDVILEAVDRCEMLWIHF